MPTYRKDVTEESMKTVLNKMLYHRVTVFFGVASLLLPTVTLASDNDYLAIEEILLGPMYSPAFTAPRRMRKIADEMHYEGNDLELPCKATGMDPITYSWFVNGVSFRRTYRLNVKKARSKLKIQRLRSQDSAVYKCIASNRYGNLSFSYPLKVRGTPAPSPRFYDLEIMKRHRFAVKPIGGAVRFRCEAKSDLPVRYRWLKDGKVLIDRRRGTGYSSYLLRLKKLKFSDVGNYTCIANNGLDSVSFSFSLHMIRVRRGGPPKVITYKKVNYIKAKVGQNASLECLELTSGILPYVSWFKWSRPVEKQYALQSIFKGERRVEKWVTSEYRHISPEHYITFNPKDYESLSKNPRIYDDTRPYGLRLTISNVTHADSGMYTCAASNHEGNDLAKLMLQVYN